MNEHRTGRLLGVSLGPGDPGLITRRAWEFLQRRDCCWTYPVRRKDADSHALQIVLCGGLTLPPQHAALIFPMTHDTDILAGYWLRAAETVLAHLHSGRDVLFLVEGDASTYSTFGHLARTVQALDAAVAIETVAGVPSFNAAAARVAMPLADTDETVAIIPAGYGIGMIERLLDDFDTLILLKVKPLLDDIIDLLQRRNLLAQAAFVEKAGAPEERVERDVQRLQGAKVNYLSLLLIRNPHRQRGELIRGCRKKTSTTELES
ncbi:precorrin-2 C(20)-methyltransferase [Methylomarinum vadi]|uniref:precorrin-2 C(20)-methyltransferase n=1 Tax=Methylomarinum vadi TaxID=438855 RepID=UPI0004DF6EAF|nr:precorrin-2 C(20)-methyltransferase [Methylomarinum vadi]